MKSQRRNRPVGNLLFWIPVVFVVLIVVYALISAATIPNGTLIVDAKSSTRYYPEVPLNVSVTVGKETGITPYRLSVSQGTYTVVFSQMRWYQTPATRIVNVAAGQSSYIVGIYNPSVVAVSVNATRFNQTAVEVMHGVTPLAFVDHSAGDARIQSSLTGLRIFSSGQNFTYVFQKPGSYSFSIPSSGAPDLVVTVV